MIQALFDMEGYMRLRSVERHNRLTFERPANDTGCGRHGTAYEGGGHHPRMRHRLYEFQGGCWGFHWTDAVVAARLI